MKNIKLNKIRRLQAFRKFFATVTDYSYTDSYKCLVGYMGTFLGIGNPDNGNGGYKTIEKYFGFEAGLAKNLMWNSYETWGKFIDIPDVLTFERSHEQALAVIDALIAEKSVDPNKLVIEVTENDARKAGSYYEGDECLLATTLKRMFPKSKISVSGYSFSVDGVFYRMTEEESSKPLRVYVASREKVDMKKFKPFTVTGTKKA